MKKLFAFFTVLFATLTAFAQGDSPYARFGYEGKVLRTPQERQQRMMLVVPNPDTTALVVAIGLDPAKQKYYLFDKQNQVLASDTLAGTTISRFLTVDPLTAKYAWYTPYQFAGNKPIQFVDIDGLEEGLNIHLKLAEQGYLKGTVSESELKETYRQKGQIGIAGATALLDAIVFKGWLTKTYLAYTFADAISNGEQSLKARNEGNPEAAAYYANQSRTAYTQFGIGFALISATNLILSDIPKGSPLFRGTTEGYPGSRMLQRVGVTPASTDPVVATIFALESKNYGTAVLKVALPQDLQGVVIGAGNTRAALEAEVGVELTPTEFSERASVTITADQARGILGKMGVKLPSTVNGIEQSTSLLKNTPRLSESQIRTFTKAAQKIAKPQ